MERILGCSGHSGPMIQTQVSQSAVVSGQDAIWM